MNDTEISVKLDQAYGFLDSSMYSQALDIFTLICDKDINNAEAWLMRGAIHGEMGNINDAISMINKAIDVDGRRSVTHTQRQPPYAQQ